MIQICYILKPGEFAQATPIVFQVMDNGKISSRSIVTLESPRQLRRKACSCGREFIEGAFLARDGRSAYECGQCALRGGLVTIEEFVFAEKRLFPFEHKPDAASRQPGAIKDLQRLKRRLPHVERRLNQVLAKVADLIGQEAFNASRRASLDVQLAGLQSEKEELLKRISLLETAVVEELPSPEPTRAVPWSERAVLILSNGEQQEGRPPLPIQEVPVQSTGS